MSDESQIELPEQIEQENGRWYARFLLYLHMGTNRTLLGAVNQEADKSGKKRSKKVPGAWDDACERFEWKRRASEYDTACQKRIEAQRQAYVDAIMSEGYALVYERIKALGEMAKTIDWSMRDPESHEYNAKWIDADKINQWRGVLDDIAKELGHRVKTNKQEVTGKDGGPIEGNVHVHVFLPDDE